MPRTAESVLAEQRIAADTDRRHRLATKGEMPAGLSPLQQTQFRIWGWWDIRHDKPNKYNFEEHRDGTAARVVPPVTPKPDINKLSTRGDHS
jgi:hypothetical protein